MKKALSSREVVEVFHLLFLRALFADVPDKALLATKGGINLRFFFASPRFSEDLDVDVTTMAKDTLEKRVDRLLASPTMVMPLKARGLVITDRSKPKQTNTVQRWKVGLATESSSIEERTKIEFSRRETTEAAAIDAIDGGIATAYSIPAFPANHYRCAEAVTQKIRALEGRSETQPRDVFDLHLLFARPDAPLVLDEDTRSKTIGAAQNADTLTYDAYKSLVVAYLDPAQADLYSSRETWEAMKAVVVEKILGLA